MLNPARACANRIFLRRSEAIHKGEDLVQPKSGNILLWMTDTRSELYEKVLFKAQSHMSLCKSPSSDGASNLHGRRPGKAKIFRSQGVPTTSEWKKTPHYEEAGRPGEQSRSQYSSGDWYRIRVVWESFFQSSILHALVQIAQLPWSKEIHAGEGLT